MRQIICGISQAYAHVLREKLQILRAAWGENSQSWSGSQGGQGSQGCSCRFLWQAALQMAQVGWGRGMVESLWMFFWAFHSLRKYQNTHFFKTRSKLRTESLMFLLPEAGDCVMGWGIILSSRWLCLLQGLQCACLVNSKAKLRPMRNEVSSLQPCLGNWAIVICVPLPCNWFLPTDLLCYYPAGTL